jgi:hypothetical protein
MADALRAIDRIDPEACRDDTSERYSVDEVAGSYAEVYTEVRGGAPRPRNAFAHLVEPGG